MGGGRLQNSHIKSKRSYREGGGAIAVGLDAGNRGIKYEKA